MPEIDKLPFPLEELRLEHGPASQKKRVVTGQAERIAHGLAQGGSGLTRQRNIWYYV